MKAKFLLLPLLFTAALRTFATPDTGVPRLAFSERKLENGLRIVSLEDHSAPTVAIQVWYRVGSKDDPPKRSGFAHLFEHMMFKSTRRTPGEFVDRLTEDIGGENNAYTENDVTVFHETVPSNHLERLLWMEAERLVSLSVDEQNFAMERDVVKEEFRQTVLAQPYGEFGEFIQKSSFTEHPYKRPTIGNIAELDAATLSEVRAFHDTFYRPDNAVLVVVGDFEPASLTRWIDAYFGPIPRPSESIPRVTAKEPARTAARTIREFDKNVPLPALAITFLGPPITDEEAPAWRIAQEVLSGGDSSRLYQALIYKKQLAQTAEFAADLRTDLGLLTFELVLANGISLENAKAALLEEIEKLKAGPVSAAELGKAKNQMIAEKLLELEKSDGKAGALGEAAALRGDPARANTDLAELQAVTAEQIQTAARKWFTESNRLMIEYLPATMKTSVSKLPAKSAKPK